MFVFLVTLTPFYSCCLSEIVTCYRLYGSFLHLFPALISPRLFIFFGSAASFMLIYNTGGLRRSQAAILLKRPTIEKHSSARVWTGQHYFALFTGSSLIRCAQGWTGNRCHVREKVIPSTPTPETEGRHLGNEAHLPARGITITVPAIIWVFSMLRIRVCWCRHRTAAAFSRSGGLFSGCVPEKMLRPVSSDAAAYLMITAGAESW